MSFLQHALRVFSRQMILGLLAWIMAYSPSVWAQPKKDNETNKLKVIHTPPVATQIGRSLTLRFQVPDNEDLDEVFLHFRRQGEKSYRSMRMALRGGDTYNATLRKFQIIQPALEYYVSALDVNKKTRYLFANPQKPHSVRVVAKLTAEDRAQTQKSEVEKPSLDDGSDSSATVFSAARREQRIQNAPGIITVITEQEIRSGGWKSLRELLRYSVGIDINDDGHSPDIGVRGINPNQAFGDKMIMLVDGHNMAWRQFNRNIMNPSWVSIDNIKRIEIIRGPGSALWGANALSGVINIITKTNTDLKGYTATTGISPLNQSYFLRLQGGQELFGGITFRAAFSLDQSRNNGLTLAPIYEFQQRGNLKYVPSGMESYSQNFYGQLSWRGFNLRFMQSRFAPNAVISGQNLLAGSSVVGGNDTLLSTDRYIVRLSWTGLLGSWGTFSIWGAYDNYGYNSDARQGVNSLSKFDSSARLRGTSQNYAIYGIEQGGQDLRFQRYYPACTELDRESDTPCIKLTTGNRGEQVCRLVTNPRQDPSQGQEFPFSQFLPKECRYVYNNGRYSTPIRAVDNRVEAGALLNAQILNNLSLTAGAEFEYLYMLGYHFPEFQSYDNDPYYVNVHFSGYLQLQYNLLNYVEFTVGGRFDYDTQYNFVATPRASIVITPGQGTYIKLLYGNAFKAPSIQDRFLFIDQNAVLFGNPILRPESVHTFELQVGWYRRGLMAISLNGYVSLFNDLIQPTLRATNDNFLGEDEWKKQTQLPKEGSLPKRLTDFVQKDNAEQITTYGGEFELRLFPTRGLNILASFGVFLGQDSQGNSLQYASTWKGALQASYLIRLGGDVGLLLSAGTVVTSGKRVPAQAFSLAESQLPAKDTGGTQPVAVPGWTAQDDPSTETPLYINTYATIQFLRLLKNLDLGLRVSNLINREQYDAGAILFYPQQKLDFYLWLRVRI
ncbi:MAG: TonB-dependent receptor plug domain-containing protein [Myxococcales bacterium]|nr:TonB-dependent receptor plug domain-containing protein [Myxococcales bacterium]